MWKNFCNVKALLWLCMPITTVLSSHVQTSEEVIRLPKNAEDSSGRELRQTLANAFENRCLTNANEKAVIELKGALFNFRCCILENIRLPTTNETSKITLNMLHTKSHKVYKCLENLIEKAATCLNLDEKYLAGLFLKAHNATVEYLTEDDDENLEAAIAAFQSANCTPSIRYMAEKFFETCAPKLDHLQALRLPDYVLKQADFCFDLTIAYKCVIDAAKSQCNDDEDVVENIKGIFEYFLNFCQNDVAADSEVTRVAFD